MKNYQKIKRILDSGHQAIIEQEGKNLLNN
jgi:hypothetical protein